MHFDALFVDTKPRNGFVSVYDTPKGDRWFTEFYDSRKEMMEELEGFVGRLHLYAIRVTLKDKTK